MPPESSEQRKLAAIMFTDMVGYSALSQRDDKLALELLEEHRQLLREILPRFNGTEIKTIGDAFLIEFNSALEAAQCAIEIQRTLAKRNHDVTAERRIELKIGIHIGDVVHRGGDVYGDGVNIASRIEPLAGAGGICVSMDVERQIRNALEARLEKLAPTDLKVISRTSTQRYKSAPNNLREIADQLGVTHVLEGSVQKAADQVRVNVQLINAQNDSHLWADKYDRKLTDIFAVETEIATKIADTLQAKLTSSEKQAIAARPTENSEAHELYLRGRFYWNKGLGPEFDKSRQYYQQAVELDPNYALAYVGLADFYGFAFAVGLLPPEEKWAKMEESMANKALELDPTLGEAYN